MKRFYTFGLRNLRAIFDTLCTPPYFYRNLSIRSQNSSLLLDIRRGKNSIKNCVLLLRNYYFIFVSFCLTPIAGLLSIFKVRFFMVDLRQIGSVLWLDLHLRDSELSGERHKCLFVLRSSFTDANKVLIDLYRDKVTFISNPILKLLLGPFFINPWFYVSGLKYEAAYEGSNTTGDLLCHAHQTCSNYIQKFSKPVISLSNVQAEECEKSLIDYIDPNRPFVLVHVRDSGYYNDKHRQLRNADIKTYEKAFKLLIDRGFSVVRLGDSNMQTTEDLQLRLGPCFFDYAHSSVRSAILDIFLASECAFFVGCASGPELLPIIFNKSACAINYYNATNCLGFKPGDLSSFKKIRYVKSGKLVPLQKLMVPPLSENPSKSELNNMGLVVEDNTDDEILQTISEFLERTNFKPSKIQAVSKAMLVEQRRSFGSPGHFSNAILKEYYSAG